MSHRFIAHLAHVEVLTPRPDESLWFYKEVLGLEESGREGQSVYLRGWGEWSYHSLQLTESAQPGIGHIGWRTWSPEHLDRAIKRVEAEGVGDGWVEDSIGHGPAYRYRGPGGHVHELLWEVENYVPPADMVSPYPSRPQRYVPRGIAPRQIDHVTVMTPEPLADARWYSKVLNYTFTEYTTLDDSDVAVFAMLTNNEKSHDLGLIIDHSDVPGRVHHVSYWVDSRDDLLRAADILMNAGVGVEFGPGRHGMGEQDYLYAREPGGVRIEINTGGYRLYVPDWETKKWSPSQGSNVFYRNLAMPESMMEACPPATYDAPTDGSANPWAAASVH
jgi:catechol 2,3-dioxygenase